MQSREQLMWFFHRDSLIRIQVLIEYIKEGEKGFLVIPIASIDRIGDASFRKSTVVAAFGHY
jgi:hypothetical protein